jgi:hypothetical protein
VLTSQPLFTALTIACIGGAFSGIGVHQSRLSFPEQVHGMQVMLSATYPSRSTEADPIVSSSSCSKCSTARPSFPSS